MAELLARDLQPGAAAQGVPAAIPRLPTGVTAFVGRALRGPVDQPVAVHGFSDFQQQFGGLWQPSTMSYAVEQYFEAGGRTALIVRVVNGGLSTTLQLPAGPERLTLRGLAPGTREYLRASVDHDGITDGERFNLVVQRVRAPGTELIDDQEIFRRVTMRADSERYVGDVLAQSRLVRMLGPPPSQRPDRTGGRTGALVGYADSNTDGNDGEELWDYDLIGSAERRSGLFALEGAAHFDLLCIPPLGRERDVGLATLVVATRLCRSRHALLVVDPPSRWANATEACEGAPAWPLHTHDACMFFPRIRAWDRLRGHHEIFASCGAAAGLLARADESSPVWAAAAGDELALRGSLRPQLTLESWQRAQLAHHGINALQTQLADRLPSCGPRTLVPELAQRSDWRHLSVRRLGLFIAACIEQGTRWALLEHNAPPLWAQVTAQVEEFLAALDADGAFVGDAAAESYFVICDERLNGGESALPGCFRLLFGFAAVRPGQFQTSLLTHRPGGSEMHAVSVNRMHTSGRRVEEEIETAILRGLEQERR